MQKSSKPIPDGYHTITPALVLGDAQKALDFYRKAFGAEVVASMSTSDGRIMHAEVRIGDSMLFVSDEYPEWSPETRSPQGSVTGSIFLYVRDADASYRRAVEAGARAVMPVQEMFWGDRFGKVVDPFGHHWGIATRTEDLSQEEIERRRDDFLKNGPPMQGQSQRNQQDARRNRSQNNSRRNTRRQEVRMDSTKDVRNESRNDPQRDQRGQGGQQGQGGQSGRGGAGGFQGGQGGRSGQGGQGDRDRQGGQGDRDRQGGQGGHQGGQGGGNEPHRQGGQPGQGGRQGQDPNRRDQDQ